MPTGTRADGRRANALRPVSIEIDVLKFPLGSVLIKAGDTHVLCAASVEDNVPDFLRGQCVGWVTADYAMLPASTPTRKARPSASSRVDGRTQEIRRLIGRCLRAVVDRTRLGERTVWIDCDVVQADGGTRTLAVTGAWVALAIALNRLRSEKTIKLSPLKTQLAAVSVGMVNGRCVLDLPYAEDARAEVDMNVVMTRAGDFVEIQGTAEGAPFGHDHLADMLRLAESGCRRLMRLQRDALKKANHGRSS